MIINPPYLDRLRALSRCDDYAEGDPRVLVAPRVLDVMPLIDYAMRAQRSRSAVDVAELLAARGVSRRATNAALLLLVGHGALVPAGDASLDVSLDEMKRCPIRSITRQRGHIVVDYYVLFEPLAALPRFPHGGAVTPPSREPALSLKTRFVVEACASIDADGAARVEPIVERLVALGHEREAVEREAKRLLRGESIWRVDGGARAAAILYLTDRAYRLFQRVPELGSVEVRLDDLTWEQGRALADCLAIAGPGNVREAGELFVRAFDAIGGAE